MILIVYCIVHEIIFWLKLNESNFYLQSTRKEIIQPTAFEVFNRKFKRTVCLKYENVIQIFLLLIFFAIQQRVIKRNEQTLMKVTKNCLCVCVK